MILLHVPYIHYRHIDYFEEQTNGLKDIIFVVIISILIFIMLLSIGSWIGKILKRQTIQYMKFIYQTSLASVVNQNSSLVEQTSEQAIEKAKELSLLLRCTIFVRYPNHTLLCSAKNGNILCIDNQ
jgi:hypothetical protein